jgi:hypothetical protein
LASHHGLEATDDVLLPSVLNCWISSYLVENLTGRASLLKKLRLEYPSLREDLELQDIQDLIEVDRRVDRDRRRRLLARSDDATDDPADRPESPSN